MSGKFSEKLLLYRLQTKHDPDAFASLYDQYVKRIYRFVYFKLGSREEAEDLTAEVFLKTWNYIIGSGDKEVKSFSGLLYRVARNCIVDFYRHRFPQSVEIVDSGLEISDGGKWYADLNNQVEARRVIQAIRKLKQEYQEVVTLRYVDELEISEIAEITGKNGIAVRVTLHRALKKLQEMMGGGL